MHVLATLRVFMHMFWQQGAYLCSCFGNIACIYVFVLATLRTRFGNYAIFCAYELASLCSIGNIARFQAYVLATRPTHRLTHKLLALTATLLRFGLNFFVCLRFIVFFLFLRAFVGFVSFSFFFVCSLATPILFGL